MYLFLRKWFRFSREQFDILELGGIGLYKIAILMFTLIPYLVLRLQS